jgi:transcriptional/translational regulatory protein YebC/TACO1
MAVHTALEEAGLEPGASELSMVPTTIIEVSTESEAKRVLRLVEALDDHDDVQNVYANFDIPDAVMAAYEG